MTKPDATYQASPPPPPMPRASDAAQAADRLEEDLRKKRGSTASSYMTGNMAPAGAVSPGKAYFG